MTRDRLDEALELQKVEGGTLTGALLASRALPEEELLRAMAQEEGLEYLPKLDFEDIDTLLVDELPINYAKTHLVLPLFRHDQAVKVLCANPDGVDAIDDMRTMLGAEVIPVLSTSEHVLDLINRTYAKRTSAVDLEENEDVSGDSEELVDIIDSTDEAPIIRWVNSLIFQAVKDRASDIHIEPGEREVIVRYRRDGVLYELRRANRGYAASISARVKIMSGLNIAEKRLPQDGRIRRRIAGKDIDMRVATAPTARGERITIRLLDKTSVVLNLADIGMGSDHLTRMNKIIQRPNGILLVTGPTGSGKTTTLYAALSQINTPDKNILTIEDPVEYQLEGISQTQVNSKIDLTFSSGLRSFLRHDPDVIMVGEIRDLETAEIAIQASLTGHLVFSTLHTNDAPGGIARLMDMKVESFLVASSVLGILAQRLVRTICPECAKFRPVTDEEVLSLGMTPEEFRVGAEEDFGFHDERRPRPPKGMVYHGEGCSTCLNTGYTGRIGIYELMMMDDAVRAMVLQRADTNAIKDEAVRVGMRTLRTDGAHKILSGLTTIEEVVRVTQEDAR
ncbi:MAG: type II secretion system ATPase GspE [Deltaproteobacteria bacterium]|nr:type II secretion system ATPase GspE [Deltaproteobacteria bacterium]